MPLQWWRAGAEVFQCDAQADGVLKCWGQDLKGQLGDGSNLDSNVPVQGYLAHKKQRPLREGRHRTLDIFLL